MTNREYMVEEMTDRLNNRRLAKRKIEEIKSFLEKALNPEVNDEEVNYIYNLTLAHVNGDARKAHF